MGVRPDHDTGPPVAPMAQGHLLGRRLAMHVDEAGLNHAAKGMFLEHRLDLAERVVEGAFHEDLAQHLRHQHLAALRRLEHAVAPARCALGEIDRADHPRLGLDELHHVLLVEGMVAQRHHVGARIQQALGMGAGQARAVAGVLAIDHHEIEPPVGAQAGQRLGHRRAAGAAHHVTQKEKSHAGGSYCGRRRRASGNGR